MSLGALVMAGCSSDSGGSNGSGGPDAGGSNGGSPDAGGSGSSSIVADQSSFDFEVEFDGETSDPETFTITNEGDGDTDALSTSIDGDGFEVATDNCDGETLSPDGSCTIEVAFAPTLTPPDGPADPQDPETFDADLIVDAGASSASVALTGEGQAAARVIIVPVENEVEIANLDPLEIDVFFGDANVDEEVSVTITATNVGAQESGVITLGDMLGTNSDDFRVIESSCIGKTLEGGESCTCNAGFEPSETGDREAEITADIEDPGALTVDFFLFGTGQ